jgi:hypothetical protein
MYGKGHESPCVRARFVRQCLKTALVNCISVMLSREATVHGSWDRVSCKCGRGGQGRCAWLSSSNAIPHSPGCMAYTRLSSGPWPLQLMPVTLTTSYSVGHRSSSETYCHNELTLWSWALLERPPVVKPLDRFAAFYGTPTVHCRIHKSSPPIPILRQTNSVHIIPIPNIHSPTSWSS